VAIYSAVQMVVKPGKKIARWRIPSNLYKIKFVTPDRGFIIGQRGVLLKYEGSSSAA
jgi:photosystem II stability/assembly factor-like uncharacterized protein